MDTPKKKKKKKNKELKKNTSILIHGQIMAGQNNGQFRLISGVDYGWGRLSPEHIIPQGRLFLRVGYGRASLFSGVD